MYFGEPAHWLIPSLYFLPPKQENATKVVTDSLVPRPTSTTSFGNSLELQTIGSYLALLNQKLLEPVFNSWHFKTFPDNSNTGSCLGNIRD